MILEVAMTTRQGGGQAEPTVASMIRLKIFSNYRLYPNLIIVETKCQGNV